MIEKICNKCNTSKVLDEYYVQIGKKDNRCNTCKDCLKLKRMLNRENLIKRSKKWHDENKDKSNENNKNYRIKNRDVLIEKRKIKSETNKLRLKLYREENKEKIKLKYNEKMSSRTEEDILLSKKKSKEYRDKNKDIIYQKSRERMSNDILFKCIKVIRSRISSSINRRKYTKKSSTYNILGCSYEEFRLYLESKFEAWMSWDNYGLYNGELNYGWDIDHIIPMSSAKTEEDVIILNHYTNLQPLCSLTNRYLKRDKSKKTI